MSIHSKVATLRNLAAQEGASTIEGDLANGGAIANTDVYSEALFVLDVTALATDAGDTLDVFIDISPDNGVMWINAVRFTTFLGDGASAKLVALLKFDIGETKLDITPANNTDFAANLAPNEVRRIGIGTMIRYRGVVTDAAAASASFTYSLQVFLR